MLMIRFPDFDSVARAGGGEGFVERIDFDWTFLC